MHDINPESRESLDVPSAVRFAQLMACGWLCFWVGVFDPGWDIDPWWERL